MDTEAYECSKCYQVKPPEAFYRDGRKKSSIGVRFKYCRDCFEAQQKKWGNRPKLKRRDWFPDQGGEIPFVVYAFEILTGDYAGWFYIGQSKSFPERFKTHQLGNSNLFPELTTALQGEEGVDWNVEFLEKRPQASVKHRFQNDIGLDELSKPEARELERQWILKYVKEGKKLLNGEIPKEAVRLLFERAP